MNILYWPNIWLDNHWHFIQSVLIDRKVLLQVIGEFIYIRILYNDPIAHRPVSIAICHRQVDLIIVVVIDLEIV